MSKTIRLYDRSRVVMDWKCPRARFYQYEYKRRGITQRTTSLELFVGILIHDALAGIARGIDAQALARAAHDQLFRSLMASVEGLGDGEAFAHEQATLIQGMILGFAKHAWPALRADYPDILHVEAENEYKHGSEALANPEEVLGSTRPDLLFMAKPDLIAAGPGGTAYIEYKSTKSKRDDWVNSWETAVQLHSSIKAVKQTLDIDIDHVIVQGLYKGYESYGKQSSPFCYAYRRSANPPFVREEITYEYRAGLKRFPTWELPGGVEAWVRSMPENILADQFPRTAPIFINDELVDSFFRQREVREQEIALTMDLLEKYEGDDEMTQRLMDTAFPQKFEQCVPSFGKPCEFRKLCFGHVEDPLNDGFVWREPHHDREREQFKLEETSETSSSTDSPAS